MATNRPSEPVEPAEPEPARPPRNLILTGFMGTGKSTVGRLVAQAACLIFVDTDARIVLREGRSIPRIFADDGEAAFRRIELDVLRELAAHSGQVIATGGGALISPQARQAVEGDNLIVCLTAAPEVIARRLASSSDRPLAQQWRELLVQRQPVYQSFPHIIDTSHRPPQRVAQEIVALWHAVSR